MAAGGSLSSVRDGMDQRRFEPSGLGVDDLDTLFAGLAEVDSVLLAVSGGPDSMALMFLASRWARRGAAPPLHVATVDHGLRPEAAAEAEMVAAAAVDLDLPHTKLAWEGPKPSTRIQERARAARYALLAAHAHAIGASHILTAHHADDQAETVLLRLGRGSGIGGLAGMRREIALGPGVTLVRPLLRYAKADLVALCLRARLSFVDDPSNADLAYARARLRGRAAELAKFGLDTAGLTRLARRMARADAALEAETARVAAALVFESDGAALHVSLRPVAGSEPEILLRLLRNVIERVVDDSGDPARSPRIVDGRRHCGFTRRHGPSRNARGSADRPEARHYACCRKGSPEAPWQGFS